MLTGLSLLHKIAGGFMLGLCLILGVSLWAADRRADKFERQLVKCEEFRRNLAEQSARQIKATGRTIEVVKERIVTVEAKAREVEKAPLPGNCRSPAEVLAANL